jgi:hypothetical protein
MAQILTPTFQTAMAAPVRRPLVVVTAYPNRVAREITTEVVAWSVERHRGQKAGKATLVVANPGGVYAMESGEARAGWLAPGTRVTMRQGLRTANGVETVPVFTGEVFAADARYRRGEGELLTVHLLDRAGRFFSQEITSPLYQNVQANAILNALFTSYGGLAPDDIQLAPVDYLVPRIQFVEEALMDAGHLLMQAARQRLFFDADGRLRSAPLQPPAEAAWTVAARDIVWAQDAWAPPPATVYTVTGRTQASLRQVGDEVLWQEVTVSGYQFGVMANVPFTPAGAVYEEIRLEPVTPLTAFEQVALYGTSGDGITVKVLSPAGRALTFRCYGKQVYYTTPSVMATVEAADLLARFGAIRDEVTNTVVKDEATALWLAGHALDEARWSQHTLTLRLLGHPGIEPGDLLALAHPRTGQPLCLLANRVAHAGRRGREEWTEVEGVCL